MTVFVAGAAGAIGKRLVPQLLESGHRVVAMTRSRENASSLRTLGAEPVIVDAFDRIAVIEAVKHAEPEVLIHQLTALTGVNDFKHFDREFAKMFSAHPTEDGSADDGAARDGIDPEDSSSTSSPRAVSPPVWRPSTPRR